jgi:UDP-N-acetylmuramate dehydrogenase
MMAARARDVRRIDRLPPVRGRYAEQVSLAAITWFRVGGPAEVLFRPADQDDLAGFLANKPADVAVTVLGVGSNLLVRDGGVPGVVIRLGRAFAGIQADGEAIEAGAGALDANVALAALEAGIGGLEFLSGVPGTIGGALRMNAGAYGGEIKDVVEKARAVAPDGTIHVLTPDALCLSYRRCGVPKDWIFLSGRLRGHSQPREAIARRMDEIRSRREATQPVRTRTGGSTFANPEGAKAWELIDRAGCRGLSIGGATVSEQHCNFLINTGGATAADLEALGEEVRRRVFAATGARLEWEIDRIGVPGGSRLTLSPEAKA